MRAHELLQELLSVYGAMASCSGVFMARHGCSWLLMSDHEWLRMFTIAHKHTWFLMSTHEQAWQSMSTHGQWTWAWRHGDRRNHEHSLALRSSYEHGAMNTHEPQNTIEPYFLVLLSVLEYSGALLSGTWMLMIAQILDSTINKKNINFWNDLPVVFWPYLVPGLTKQ